LTPERSILTPEEQEVVQHGTILGRHRLQEQFQNLEQQTETALIGMWVFLATEVLFFGTLFISLAVYRYRDDAAFTTASERLNWAIGGINTVILLTSSLTMVLGVHFARLGLRRPLVWMLVVTAFLGCCFMGFKAVEYTQDYEEYLIPGWRFQDAEWLDRGPGTAASHGATLTTGQVPHVKLFLFLYWTMTGLHAFHVLIGILVIAGLAVLAHRGHYSSVYYTPIEVVGLYWHFVDLVWIFLFPMLYLIGLHNWSDMHVF
jgi:cytochrome c oxidase subunit III